MNKRIITISSFLVLLILSGCGTTTITETTDIIIEEGTANFTKSFVVGDNGSTSEDLYGLVISDDSKTITTTVGGTLSYLNCQPGKRVYPGTVIATVDINENDTNIKNIELQKKSLKEQLRNIEKNYNITEQNFDIQKQNILLQSEDAQDSILDSIQNFKSQQEVSISDAFKKIKDNSSRTRDSGLYDDLYDDRNDIQDMSDDRFSDYLEDMANLMVKAAKYSSGDNIYNMFIGLSNGFRSTKSAFDSLVTRYKSTTSDYSQDNQLELIDNNKEMQLNSLENQMKSIEQSIESLTNTLEGETIYAGINGVVRSKNINEGNKVNPNTPICNISSNDSLKLQIYSSFPISIGQIVKLYNGDEVLGAAKIQYELPYKDPTTQNYIYEITNTNLKLKDGDKITIKINKKLDDTKIRIPIQYVIPQLDGDFVNLKKESGIAKTQIQMGDINGGFIEILKGLSKGDEIVN